MGLLHKRPLALFCICFLCGLYGAFLISSRAKLWCFFALGGVAVLLLLLSFACKKWRIRLLALMLCVLSLAFAFLHAYGRVDRQREEALSYTGKRTVECQILSISKVDSYHTECVASLLQIGEDRTDIRVYLICGFSAKLHAGDRMAARVELIETDESAYGVCAADEIRDTRVLLAAVLHEENDAQLLSCMENEPISRLIVEKNGVELASDRLRAIMASVFDGAFGKEISPLARSFFVGDKEALSPRIERDFRRTGTSHLLAVSGLHIAILLGGLEWLLRRLTLPKGVRMAIVSLAGVLLLMATGFSMSACRSVLMLFMVYLHYLFAKENDALTSLLVAVSLILLVSPHAFFDLGLWMSFFATLGLLTLYPLIDRALPRKRGTARLGRVLWRLLRFAVMTAAMSVITGLFLLPIQYAVFREISLCTIPANLILAPLGTCYLYAIPLALLLSPIPWIGALAKTLLLWLGRGMTAVLSLFSEQNFAMLSLQYTFAGVIVALLALSMLVLLLVRLRHKWLLAIPPVAAVICFAVCLLVTYQSELPIVSDYTNDDQRLLVVSMRGESVWFDHSCESTRAYFDGADTMQMQAATDVDGLVLGHLSEEHPQMLERFMLYTVVHRLYLPKALAEEQISLAREIGAIAEEAGCEVYLYSDNTPFLAANSFMMRIAMGKTCASAMALDADGALLTMMDRSYDADAMWQSLVAESHTVLLCCSSCEEGDGDHVLNAGAETEQIVWRHSHAHEYTPITEGRPTVYCYPHDGKKRILSFFLGS